MKKSKLKVITGRPPMIKEIKKAKRLSKQGLSYREIAKLMDSDVKTVYRWVNYEL